MNYQVLLPKTRDMIYCNVIIVFLIVIKLDFIINTNNLGCISI